MKRLTCFAFSLVALTLGIVIAGCGGGSSQNFITPPNITVSMTVANNTGLLEAGSSVLITATANNDTSGKGVTWNISPMTGTLTNVTGSSVTYNAPATPPPSDVLVTITATSVADPTKSTNVGLDVPAITVSLSANPNTVGATGLSTITATVNFDPANKGVSPASWTISPATGAGTLSNPTSTTVTYTAPPTPPANDVQVTIQATSASDPTKTAPPTGITFAAIAVSLSANPLLVQACPIQPCPAGTSQITATVSFDSANKGVDPTSWKITSPLTGGGTLSIPTSTTVTYTAPPTPPASDVPVIIQATSASDSTKSGPVTITFKAITVSVTPNPATVPEDTSPQFTATVNFDPSNGGVTWALTQGTPPLPCSPAPACGTISATSSLSGTPITYNAPSAVPSPNTVTLTATSVADTTKTRPVTITVLNPDSALNGHYAFLFNGFDDATGKQVAVAGSFTADGFGNITNGVEDINGPSGPQTSVTFTGTYIIGLDNRGTATFANSLGGNVTYALVVSSFNAGVATKAHLIEFDDTTGATGTRGSGFMRLQDPTAFSLSKITGPYGFGISGQDSKAGRIAIAGIFSADGAGNISGGLEDINDAGTVTNSVSFTGSYSAPDATNGRVTGGVSSPAPTTHFSLYVVSASEALMMTTDAESTAGLESGSVLSQVPAPYTDGSLNAGSVFYEVGVNGASPTTQSDVRIGLFSANGSGGLSITSDENDGGSFTIDNTISNLTYSVASNGRVTITGGSGSQPILYLVGTNKAFFLGAGASVGFGFLEPQSAGSFGSLSITGTYFFGVAPPAVTASTVSSGFGTATHGRFRFFFFNTLRVTQDSSVSNGTLTSGATSFSNFNVFSNRRTTTGNGSVIYLISPSKFVQIHQSDVAPTVSIFEK
ncbi:MAG: beta strand repeat-containing protein [Candidatus Acidiferrales bacterium]